MSIEEVTEVCRLCLKNENLVWVFDKRFENTENMKDVIFITTGVEINLNDFVTQKICTKCLQITIKIYQFRQTSMDNDALLKNKHKELIKHETVNSPSTSTGIKRERPLETKPLKKKFHPSVKKIMKTYPNFVLPKSCLHINMAPYVSMPMNEVENYFKKQNLNMQAQILYTLQALKSEKRTSDVRVKTENKIVLKTSDQEYKDCKKIAPDHNINNKANDCKKCDLKRELFSHDSSPEIDSIRIRKKRRISDSSTDSEKKENERPIVDSPSETNKEIKTQAVPVQVSYVERTIEICDICNSVHYNMRDLKRHQLNHLRCQFCKARFKTMELKEKHIEENCVIMKAMNPSNLPTINLIKVEGILGMRLKYPEAFESFPKVSQKNTLLTKGDSLGTTSTVPEHVTAETRDNIVSDVIEILSDDDCSDEVPTVQETVKSTKTSSTVSSIPQNDLQASTVAPVNQMVVHNTENVSSSIVKPDIRIKNNYILDGIDPKATDMIVLKELLRSYRKVQLNKNTAVQSELPSNTCIVTNLQDFTANLKNLKHHLHIYKIPVDIKKGSYKVSFDYTPKPKKVKSMADWKGLQPVDLIVPNNSSDTPERPSVVSSTYDPVSTQRSVPRASPPSYDSIYPKTYPASKSHTVSYQPNSSSIAQVNLIQNCTPTLIVNQTNNFLSYNQNNTMYNTNNTLYNTNNTLYNTNNTLYNTNNTVYNSNPSVIIPNSVPQVLVPTTPVYQSAVLNSNPAQSVHAGSSPSSSLVLLPSGSSASSVSYSNVEPGVSFQSYNVSSTQAASSGSVVARTSSNSLLKNLLFEPGATSTSTSSNPMPLIRVKDLLELK